jgi:hypothetical protein
MSQAAGSPFIFLGSERRRGIPDACMVARNWDELAGMLLPQAA